MKWYLNKADQAKSTKAVKEMPGIYSLSKKYEPLCSSQILMSKNLVEEVIRVLEEEYFNPFSVLIVEECFFNLSSGIPVNNLLDDEILQTEELGKKLALAFATKRLVENGGKKFHEVLPKTKLPSFKNTARSVTIQKNNKQRIVQVNRDILSWLIHLSAGRRLVANYEMAMDIHCHQCP